MTWQDTNPQARLTDPKQAVKPFHCTWAEAQAYCNFPVLAPSALPQGCSVVEVWLRPELPPGRPEGLDRSEYGWPTWGEANYATVRAVIAGEGLRIRLKQFLYDYNLVPAAGIPNLWGNGPVTAQPGPEAPAFTGRDYKGRKGACIELYRTVTELSVEEGEVTDAELAAILHSLAPAVPEALPALTGAAWTELSYFRRYRLGHDPVPLGYFEFKRKLAAAPRRPATAADVRRVVGVEPPKAPAGFRVDGYAVCDEGGYKEAEVHFYDGKHRRIAMLLIPEGPVLPLPKSERNSAERYSGNTASGPSGVEAWWRLEGGVVAGAWGLAGVTQADLAALLPQETKK